MAIPADSDILVLGGTGELGSEIVKALRAADKRVTVLARPTSNRERLQDQNISYVIGDMLVEADMERVFTATKYKSVVDASSGPYRGMEGADNELLQAQAFYADSQKIVSKWAASTGVRQFILHSTVGAGGSADLVYVDNVFEVQKRALASKTLAEQVLIKSGLRYTIIRHLTVLPLTLQESGKARLSRDLTEVGAVTRDGLARLTRECLDNNACLNIIFHALDDGVELPPETIEIWKQALKPDFFPTYLDR